MCSGVSDLASSREHPETGKLIAEIVGPAPVDRGLCAAAHNADQAALPLRLLSANYGHPGYSMADTQILKNGRLAQRTRGGV